jgi:hypothetical protein
MQNHQPNQAQTQQVNDFDDAVAKAIQMAQSGVNMETEFRNEVSKNPSKAQAFAQFMQQNQGRNPWDIAYELMAKRGINPAMYGLPPRK